MYLTHLSLDDESKVKCGSKMTVSKGEFNVLTLMLI